MRTLVIGGGFAGLLAAKKLDATLISDQEHFVFLPRLPQLLRKNPPRVTIPLTKCHEDVIIGKATPDLDKKVVLVNGQELPYDELVIATGAQSTNPIPGSRYAHNFYTLADAQKIKGTTNQQVVIIGAGPTGVEVAMELANNNTVTLLQRGDTILPTYKENTRAYAKKQLANAGVQLLTNNPVKKITKKYVHAHNKHRYDVAIWTAGVKPTKPVGNQPLAVDKYMRVQEDVWAIGDCAINNSPLTAQAAQQEALHAAKNIVRARKNKPLKPFRFHQKGQALLLADKAVLESALTLNGRVAAWMRELYYSLQLLRYQF